MSTGKGDQPQFATCEASFLASQEGQDLLARQADMTPEEWASELAQGIELMHQVGDCQGPAY